MTVEPHQKTAVTPDNGVCPVCGHCKHCGHSPHPVPVVPWPNPYPVFPTVPVVPYTPPQYTPWIVGTDLPVRNICGSAQTIGNEVGAMQCQ